MAPRLILTLFAIAFGLAVVGAAVTTVQEMTLTAAAHETRSSPASVRRLDSTSMDPRYDHKNQ